MSSIPSYSLVYQGIIKGTVIDENTGEPLIGVTVLVKGTKLGAWTDVKGNFRIKNVPVGQYSLLLKYVGHSTAEITLVDVLPEEVTLVEATMTEKRIVANEVVVSARASKNTEAALLMKRRNADSFQDAISSEDISRSSSSDAAEAIKRVTGATTVGGKHVFIRGLGERYSSTQLNGAVIPSSDPDKKSVHLDLFPTTLIDNITTIKTATPDRPGNFTGGTIDISTRAFPDKFRFWFSASSAYNFETTGSNMLTYAGSSTDWLGFDNESRNIPDIILNNEIPDITSTRSKTKGMESALLLDEMTKAFNPVFAPTNKIAPVNRKFAFSIGNQHELFKNPFGYLASFSYGRKFTSNRESIVGNYNQATGESKELEAEYIADVNEATDDVHWGALTNIAYDLSANNRLSFNIMHNQSAESKAVYQDGYKRTYQNLMETRILSFIERSLSSFQLSGKHNAPSFLDSKIDWQMSYSKNSQYQPDFRTFDNEYEMVEIDGNLERKYYMPRSDNNALPSRYYRDLDEDIQGGMINLEIPLKEYFDSDVKFKTGFLYNDKNRDFVENRFVYQQDSDDLQYDGDPNSFITDNSGIDEEKSQGNFNYFGNYIQDRTQASGSYTGSEKKFAVYGMLNMFLLDNFRVVGGIRLEKTDMQTISQDSLRPQGIIDENDLLPSMNMTYLFTKEMSLRFAYSKTIAEPTLREIAPYDSYMPIEHRVFNGNDQLERTLIDNFDIRWEWFPSLNELVSIGVFYKDFTNPIEIVVVNANNNIQPQNVKKALLYGAEIDFRKNLGFISDYTRNFQFGMNFTFVHSEVDLSEFELQSRLAYDPNASSSRALQGQSPYIVNLDMTYFNESSNTEANIHFNVFGKRLTEVGDGSPDYYEYPKPLLNLVVSQKITGSLKAKLAYKNILNSRTYIAADLLGSEYVRRAYYTGSVLSFSLTYDIN